MGQQAEGGGEKNQSLARFEAYAGDITAKDQIDLMSRCWFSLTPSRTKPIEHEFKNSKTNRIETVRVTGSAEHGIATIHDNDLIIFAISQWVDARKRGEEPSRRISFTPYQYFIWMNKAPHGSAYQRLKDSLQRLQTTNIETTIRSTTERKGRLKQFSWISEFSIEEEDGRAKGIEVVLAEWLFESIRDFHVLTLDKRYFEIQGSFERWLYLYAKKATGGLTGAWKESFKLLYKKSSSQQEYKHFAHSLRKLVEKNELPGLRLSRHASARGGEMLGMERTEKRELRASDNQAVIPEVPVVELSPFEETWENVLDLLRAQLTAATVASWLEKLEFVQVAEGILTFRAPTKFIAERVASIYSPRIKAAWATLGHEISGIRFESEKKRSAA